MAESKNDFTSRAAGVEKVLGNQPATLPAETTIKVVNADQTEGPYRDCQSECELEFSCIPPKQVGLLS